MSRRTQRSTLGYVAAALAAPLALSACVGPTPYQPVGASNASGGYSDQQIEANRFRVSFAGNQFTSRERVDNYLLFRAAELTLRNGFDSFRIARRATDRDVETRVDRPFHSGPYGYWAPYWRFFGPYGSHYYDPFLRDSFFGGPVTVRNIERYQASAEIVMEKGLDPGDPMSFDAREVTQNLQREIVYPS